MWCVLVRWLNVLCIQFGYIFNDLVWICGMDSEEGNGMRGMEKMGGLLLWLPSEDLLLPLSPQWKGEGLLL